MHGLWSSLSEVAGRLGTGGRSLTFPPLKLHVTEQRVVIKECPSGGQPNGGTFPEEVPCGGSYGAGVKGVLTYLNRHHVQGCTYSQAHRLP